MVNDHTSIYFDAEESNSNALNRYNEDFHLALFLTGNKAEQSWVAKEEKTTFFELKAHLMNVFVRLGVKECDILSVLLKIYRAMQVVFVNLINILLGMTIKTDLPFISIYSVSVLPEYSPFAITL